MRAVFLLFSFLCAVTAMADEFTDEQQKALGVYEPIAAYQNASPEDKPALYPAYLEATRIWSFGSKEAYEAHQADRLIIGKQLYHIQEIIRAQKEIAFIKNGLDSAVMPDGAHELYTKITQLVQQFDAKMRQYLVKVARGQEITTIEEQATAIVAAYGVPNPTPTPGYSLLASFEPENLKDPATQKAIEDFTKKLEAELPHLRMYNEEQMAREYSRLPEEEPRP